MKSCCRYVAKLPIYFLLPPHTQPVTRGRTLECAPTAAPTMRPTFDGETYSPTRRPTPTPVGVCIWRHVNARRFTPCFAHLASPASLQRYRTQTRVPTPAPTRTCFPGEYRPTPSSPCEFCAPGTYWNQTYETTACLNCPAGLTSLQGAVRCYTPCAPNTALNTTDLTCVPIPQSLQNALAAANITIDFNTTEVFLVEEPTKYEDTLGVAAAAGNQTVVISLAPNTLYPQTQGYVFTSNVVIVADGVTGGGRRQRQLQTVRAGKNVLTVCFEQGCGRPFLSLCISYISSQQASVPIVYALSDARHYTMQNATIVTEGVIFEGSPNGAYSGGIELTQQAMGYFYTTSFRRCRWQGDGGALRLVGGSTAQLGTYVEREGSDRSVCVGVQFNLSHPSVHSKRSWHRLLTHIQGLRAHWQYGQQGRRRLRRPGLHSNCQQYRELLQQHGAALLGWCSLPRLWRNRDDRQVRTCVRCVWCVV